MSINYVMEPVEIMGLKNLKGGVSQESTWFLGGLFKSPRWSTRGRGGQICPKIGPHGLRMPPNLKRCILAHILIVNNQHT